MPKSPITIYKSESCGGCRELLPVLKKLAKKKRIPVKVIDVENCKTQTCEKLDYVPYIVYKKRTIKTRQELARILGVTKK